MSVNILPLIIIWFGTGGIIGSLMVAKQWYIGKHIIVLDIEKLVVRTIVGPIMIYVSIHQLMMYRGGVIIKGRKKKND